MDGSGMGFRGASSTFPAPQGHPNPAARSRCPPEPLTGCRNVLQIVLELGAKAVRK